MKRETLLDWRRPLSKFGYAGPKTSQHRQVIDSHLEALDVIAVLRSQRDAVIALVDGWMAGFGPGTEPDRVFGAQVVSVPFVHAKIHGIVDGNDGPGPQPVGRDHVCRPAAAVGDADTFTCEVCGVEYWRVDATWRVAGEPDKAARGES